MSTRLLVRNARRSEDPDRSKMGHHVGSVNTQMTRFTFSPAASVSPDENYVLKLVWQEPMAVVEDSPESYRAGGDYLGGDRIWRGVPDAARSVLSRRSFRAAPVVQQFACDDIFLMLDADAGTGAKSNYPNP